MDADERGCLHASHYELPPARLATDPSPGLQLLQLYRQHDGIGVRALEGLLPPHEVEKLLELMHRFGGYVSMKANPDGSDSPYEINIAYYDAMKGTRRGPDAWQVERFLCSQNLLLTLQASVIKQNFMEY